MRVLIISQYFWPEQFRINDIVSDLTKRGYEVDVLTGKPNYPQGKLYEDFKLNHKKYKKYGDANIYRVPIWLRKNSNKVNLFLNYLSFVFSGIFFGFFYLRKKKYDYIFTFATSPITVAIVSIFFSKVKNAKTVLWVLDLWPNILLELSIIRNKFLYSLLKKLVIKIYLSHDLILAQSQTFINIIKKQIYPKKKNIFYFPAWPETLISNKQNSINEQYNPTNENKKKINIVFTGNVGEAQNFDNIFKVARELKNEENIHWTIIGTGRKLEEIKLLVDSENIKNFYFKGHVQLSEVKRYHDEADILLISLSKGEGLSGTIPGKLQTYLNSQKFILGMIQGEAKKIIETTNSGICFDPEDHEGVVNFLKNVVHNKNLIKIDNFLSVKNYLNKHFNKERILNELQTYFKQLSKDLNLKLISNISKIPFDKNFSLSGLNLAFIGFYNLNVIRLHENLYLWPDGIFAKRFYKNIAKIPGRSLVKNIKLPELIKKIYVIGNLTEKSKIYLENLYKRNIVHIDLPYGKVEDLFNNHCKINFSNSDLIIITLPTPKQELMSEMIKNYSKNYKILCVGGAVTMASGEEKQIPIFFDNYGLEFLWRLKTDTRRRIYRLFVSFSSYVVGLIFMKYKKFKKTLI